MAPVSRRWPDSTIAIIAPGPSLTEHDASAAHAAADHVIAVGDAWRLARRADLLYHADGPWWWIHGGVPGFRGERWTQNKRPAKPQRPQPHGDCVAAFGPRAVRSENGEGVSFDAGMIHHGGVSGFQALNLAVLFGARRILLLGFDMQRAGGKTHFFGDHPNRLRRTLSFRRLRRPFAVAARQLDRAGIEVINATRATALTCFERAPFPALHAAQEHAE
jgi:hypothetical protein